MTLAFLAVAALAAAPASAQEPAISEQEARAIGVDAYLYLYPLVTMEVTRRQLTNVAPGSKFGKGPMNMFHNLPAYPPADERSVVRPNFDTLYSIAYLDMTKGPVVVSVPDTGGRYYLLPMLDMWSDVFASPGWRTTGTKAADYLVTPQGWTGEVAEGFTRIVAPTPYVWIIGRTKTDGPADYEAVHAIQAGFKVTPFAQWGKALEPPTFELDPTVDMQTPPKIQVDTMSAERFFSYGSELMALNPPHVTDQPIIARMKRIGIEAGKGFAFATLDPAVQKGLADVPQEAQRLMQWKMPTLARVANGWLMNTDTMGVYGNYYLKRAIVAREGLGANLPEDAVYPLNLGDEAGKPLEGTNNYTIHFDKASLPPVEAFWSITLYDADGFQVPNALNRFAVSSWMPFRYEADGSLTLYVQAEGPGADNEQNWLPAPKGGFNLTMRLYAPKADVLTGKWNLPPVTRAQAPGLFQAQ
jgi:hypothetical protein